MAFVRLDDGPRPFDDILQAQRVAAGMQQQGFQNALALQQFAAQREQSARGLDLESQRLNAGLQQQGFQNSLALQEFEVQREQGARELDIQEQRNNLIGRETRQRSVSRAMDLAKRSGRQVPLGVQGLEEMAQYLRGRNPEALAAAVQPFAHLEFDEGVDPLSTPEGAQAFEALAGVYLAEQGREAGEVASRVMVQAQGLMSDPRAGLSDRDLEPLMGLVEQGTATREQVEAQYQAIRTKAAQNIGFAEMRTSVLSEAQQAWGAAMTSLRGTKSMTIPGEPSDADKLMELRGAIETATTPEELRKARGQYLVKAYGLDGVISEAEDAAMQAGYAAAMAQFSGARDAALGRQGMAPAQAHAGAMPTAAAPNGSPAVDAERFPNLMAATGRAMGEPEVPRGELSDDDAMTILKDAGFEDIPDAGTPQAAEAARLLDDVQSRAMRVVEQFESQPNEDGDPPLTVLADEAGVPRRIASEIWQSRQQGRADEAAVKRYARTVLRQLRDVDTDLPDESIVTEIVRRKIAPSRAMAAKTVEYLRGTGW